MSSSRTIRTDILACSLAVAAANYVFFSPAKATPDRLEDARAELLAKSNQLPDEQTVQLIQNALEKDPHDSLAHLTMAACYERMGLSDLATQEFELAVKFGPDDPHAILQSIKSELSEGRPYSAMRLLQAASERFPNDPEVMYWKANYLVTADHKLEAAKIYQMALSKKKKILGVACALGDLYLDQRRYGDALKLAEQDLAINPNYWLGNSIKGMALAGMGRYDLAVAPLKKAFEQMPLRSELALTYAKSCMWTGDYQQALDPAIVTLAISSSLVSNSFVQKRFLLSILKHVDADFAAARIAYWGPKLDAAFHNAGFHFAMGDVLDSANMPQVAINEYKAGLRLSPMFARGIFRLGRDLELDRRMYPEALDCYTRAHMLAANDKEIENYMVRLQQRLPARQTDLAWEFRDWLSNVYNSPQKEIK